MGVKTITTTDYDLIERFQDEHESFAREAFIEFYDKYSSYIYRTCHLFVMDNQHVHDVKADAEDLSQKVIDKIYRSNTFKRKKDILPEEITFHIRGWIYLIIKNAFNDEYVKKVERRPKLVRIESKTQDEIEFKYTNKQSEVKTVLSKENLEKYKMIELAMSQIKMSDKELDVLRVYLESGWFDERDNWILPQERMNELTDKYNVQKNSIIQCKSRLMTKVKAKIKSH